MLHYDEKRKYHRMEVDCPARFRLQGAEETAGAIVKNLSGGGLLMWIDKEVEPGTQLSIVVVPGKSITPPLSAVVEVVRSYSLDTGEEGQFAVACVIKEVKNEDTPSAGTP